MSQNFERGSKMKYFKIVVTTAEGKIITGPFKFPKLKAVALAGTGRKYFKRKTKKGKITRRTKYEVIEASKKDNLIEWFPELQNSLPEYVKKVIERGQQK